MAASASSNKHTVSNKESNDMMPNELKTNFNSSRLDAMPNANLQDLTRRSAKKQKQKKRRKRNCRQLQNSREKHEIWLEILNLYFPSQI
jgi:hypothetical protein